MKGPGDGMAVKAPRWMDFTGERVPIVPEEGPPMALPWSSTFHRHGDGCLWTIVYPFDSGPQVDREQVACTVTGMWYLRKYAGDPPDGQ